MLTKQIRLVVPFAAAFMLCACSYDSGSGASDTIVASAGEYQYKGAQDQLTTSSGAERAGDLATRFDRVQGRE